MYSYKPIGLICLCIDGMYAVIDLISYISFPLISCRTEHINMFCAIFYQKILLRFSNGMICGLTQLRSCAKGTMGCRTGGAMFREVKLILATEKDADLIHRMKYEAFLPLYEKYHDDETSPTKENLEKLKYQLQNEWSDYYIIQWNDVNVGAVRIVKKLRNAAFSEGIFYISPIFILPKYQNQGIGYKALQNIFELYDQAVVWRLDTIRQEPGNCHLYEKCGFVRTGKEYPVNDCMTLIDYEKVNVSVRKFTDSDAEAVASLIARNFKEVNIKDYGEKAISALVQTHHADWVRQIASYAHMYVFCRNEEIVAVGSISSFWGSETESIILTVFVLPELHGKGIGRTIIRTLEQDALFTRADRIEIPASITAVEFYRKLGYNYKNGIKELDAEGHYRLEKFNDKALIN